MSFLNFTEKEVSFGQAKYATIVERRVTISNISSIDIPISVMNTSCSCTQGSLSSPVVKANGNVLLTITLDTARSGSGFVAKTLNLKYVVSGKEMIEEVKIAGEVIN